MYHQGNDNSSHTTKGAEADAPRSSVSIMHEDVHRERLAMKLAERGACIARQEPDSIDIDPSSIYDSKVREKKDWGAEEHGPEARLKDVQQTMSNGDVITFGRNIDGQFDFKIVDAKGNPVEVGPAIPSQAADLGTKHELSNGAVYTGRGGWNPNQSIVYPTGERIVFTQDGEIVRSNVDADAGRPPAGR